MSKRAGNRVGFKSAIEALQGVDEKTRLRILSEVAQKDPQTALALREGLFEFSDIQYFLKTDFQIIWWEIPKTTWHLALRKTQANVMSRIASFLSKRAFAQLQEDILAMGPKPLSQVLKAQKEVCDAIRSLAEQGKIAMPTRNKNDPQV